MQRPLWQIFLATIVAAFGVMRAGAATVVWSHDGFGPLVLSLLTQATGALLAALGLWVGGRAMHVGLWTLVGGFVASIATGLLSGLRSPAIAVVQLGAIVLGVGALSYLIRVATESDPDAS